MMTLVPIVCAAKHTTSRGIADCKIQMTRVEGQLLLPLAMKVPTQQGGATAMEREVAAVTSKRSQVRLQTISSMAVLHQTMVT